MPVYRPALGTRGGHPFTSRLDGQTSRGSYPVGHVPWPLARPLQSVRRWRRNQWLPHWRWLELSSWRRRCWPPPCFLAALHLGRLISRDDGQQAVGEDASDEPLLESHRSEHHRRSAARSARCRSFGDARRARGEHFWGPV